MVAISCDPILTGPAKFERSGRTVPPDTLVDIEERARLLAVAPYLDVLALARHGDLAANRGGRLFAPFSPGPLPPEDIVVPRYNMSAFHSFGDKPNTDAH